MESAAVPTPGSATGAASPTWSWWRTWHRSRRPRSRGGEGWR